MKISALKKYPIFYFTAALVLVALKLFYRSADSDDLQWILAPTAWWVGILSGNSFEYLPHVGYVNHDLRFVIASSCSGFQFMLICAAALIFSFLHRLVPAGSPKGERDAGIFRLLNKLFRGFCFIAAGFVLSYVLTIWVNSIRILLSISLPPLLEETSLLGKDNLSNGWLTHERLHTLIGTVVYFSSLLVIYQGADRLTLKLCPCPDPFSKSPEADMANDRLKASAIPGSKAFFRLLRPALWYFFFVLGIPILTRAYRNGPAQFVDYEVLVVLAGAVLLTLFTLIESLRR